MKVGHKTRCTRGRRVMLRRGVGSVVMFQKYKDTQTLSHKKASVAKRRSCTMGIISIQEGLSF